MKILVASDIHGSAYWCKRLMEAFEREQPDRLLLLGDILYHGPRNDLPRDYCPKDVFPMLNGIKDRVLCVRGNCDSDVDQMVLEFPIMAENLILYAGKRMIFVTHGHVYNEQTPPKLVKGDILMHGHTHVQVCRQNDVYTYVNPGSVSLPKDDSVNGYMIVTDEALVWKNMDGDQIMRYAL